MAWTSSPWAYPEGPPPRRGRRATSSSLPVVSDESTAGGRRGTAVMANDQAEGSMIKRIIVGVDGSEGATLALRWAVGLAKDEGAEIIAVYALGPVEDVTRGASNAVFVGLGMGWSKQSAWRDELRRELEELVRPASNRGCADQGASRKGVCRGRAHGRRRPGGCRPYCRRGARARWLRGSRAGERQLQGQPSGSPAGRHRPPGSPADTCLGPTSS